MKKLKTTNLVRAVVGLLFVSRLSIALAADVISLWGGARGNIILKSDGTVWTWGTGGFGKLGINAFTGRSLVPVEVHGATNIDYLHSVMAVMGGETHNLALQTDGTLWAWGYNGFGQLGNGTTNDAATPVQVGLGSNPPLTNVIKLGGRTYFSLAVKSDGSIWGWGMNGTGQMGNGTTGANVLTPVMVSNSQPGHLVNNPAQVSCGFTYGVALLANSTVWKWGLNDVGELGLGTNDNAGVGPAVDLIAHPFPMQVTLDKFGNGFSNVVKVSNRDYHNFALKADGSLWMWGANDQGQCGDGTTNDIYRPSPVVGLGARTPLRLNLEKNAQPGFADLKWSSATGEYFAVEYTTNPAIGFTGGLSNILATPPTNTITVPATNSSYFYRLRF